jgi:pimeloyl-ACP methyl ester carboxylesterase
MKKLPLSYLAHCFGQQLLQTKVSKSLAVALVLILISPLTLGSAQAPQGSTPLDIGHGTLMANIWTPRSEPYETIIALPGSGGDVTRFRLIGPLLAEAGFQVVALNQRGIMGSTGALNDLNLYDFAADVIAVADVLKLDEFHMLGWALGNRISRAAALKYPDRIATVSLLAAGGLVKPLTVPGELGQLLENNNLKLDQKVALAKRTLFSQASPEELILHYAVSLNYWPQARQAQIQANRATPLKQWWAGGTGPMLIIQGLDDKTAPPENGELMKKEFDQRITLVNLADAGHLMGLEKPEQTALAITAFLRQHSIGK